MRARGECGEGIGAYRRHRRNGEEPCEACREFYRKYQVKARTAKRRRDRERSTGVSDGVVALGVAAEGVQRVNAHGSHPMREFVAPPCPDPRCGEPMVAIASGVYECPNEHTVRKRPLGVRS